MEQPRKQFEMWPRKMTSKELREELDKKNDELRRAGNYGWKKSEDLVSKEETTEVLEGKDAKLVKVLSPEATGKKAGEFVKELEEKEKRNKKE